MFIIAATRVPGSISVWGLSVWSLHVFSLYSMHEFFLGPPASSKNMHVQFIDDSIVDPQNECRWLFVNLLLTPNTAIGLKKYICSLFMYRLHRYISESNVCNTVTQFVLFCFYSVSHSL